VSDDVVRVAIHKRPAPTQSVMLINMYVPSFIACCDYLLILGPSYIQLVRVLTSELWNTGLCLGSRLRLSGVVPCSTAFTLVVFWENCTFTSFT